MTSLLQKTRGMNRLIQRTVGQPVAFDEMAAVLARLTETNVLIVGRRGRVLGAAYTGGTTEPILDEEILKNGQVTDQYNDHLLNFSRTELAEGRAPGRIMSIVPVFGGGERLGTLIFERSGEKFTDDDFILAEYAATITGIEVMRLKNERLEKDTRERASVQLAMDVLSYSEIEALRYIFNDLQGEEGFVVASKLAEKYRLTRSVIVNALRKLESAGVIDSRSLGMKGTYIKVLNHYLLDFLKVQPV
ncbi:MAG: GTP-sensing pleiotropic transcriptional regulator CodY [Clostridia bacterium]|nr:GTP-sensing pleiotropic transcriptional regulator CodY [Clostridia bacterium]